MYVKGIWIDNIRIIDELRIEFKSPFNGWHVIIGDNGSGKSSVIRAIALALVGPMEAPSLRTSWNEWLSRKTKEGSINLFIDNELSLDKQTGKSAPLKKKYILNELTFLREETGQVSFTSNYKKTSKGIVDPARFNWGDGGGWFSVAFGPFRRFTGGNTDWSKVFYAFPKAGAHLSVFSEDVALTEALSWLKELDYRRLKEQEYAGGANDNQMIFEKVREFINKSGLLPHGASFERIDETPIFLDGEKNEISVVQLSDGYRSILSLTFELIRQLIRTYGQDEVFKDIHANNEIRLPGVVLIDEIDAHLHPSWQTRIGHWFTKHFPNLQFIVTTHSPLICRACDKGTIWRLPSPGNGRKTEEVKGDDREKLIYGNILDAYGTEIFGTTPVRSDISNQKLERLGKLNMLAAMGKITDEEEKERLGLQQILSSDAPTGQ